MQRNANEGETLDRLERAPSIPSEATAASSRDALLLAPIVLTLAYPFLLKAFHASVAPDGLGWTAGSILLLCIFAVPLVGLLWAHRLTMSSHDPSPFQIRARQLAYFTMAAPPLFVFIGVARGLVGRPLTDEIVWIGVWLLATAYVFMRGDSRIDTALPASTPRLRVAHGITATFILLFVCFHLTNHLSGWWGPETHASIMRLGRNVYRLPIVEIVLVGSLLFQAASGITLALRWSRTNGDGFRVFQIGSGIYIAAFVVAHLNSALISARAVRGTETDWAWASGGDEGLIYDAWNIRLVPHYALGVFFVLSHLTTGLRHVLIAHGVDSRLANRIWTTSTIVAALIAGTIMAALFGARL